MKNGWKVLLCAGALLAAGCSQRMIDFTIISSKNVDLSNAARFTRGTQRVEGKDTAYIIVFIPTGMPNVKEAVDRAIEKVPGAVALVDGVVMFNYGNVVLFGWNAYVVEGTPLIDPTLLGDRNLPSERMISYWNAKTQDVDVVYVSEEDYERAKAAIEAGDSATVEKILERVSG